MTTRRTFFLATPVLLVHAVIAAPPAVDTSKAGMDAERLARIPARMKSFVDKGTVAGTVTLLQRHGALASLETAGYQDLASKKPMKPDTIFQIMSMTKPVVGAAVMILMEEGKLAISDPVEKHLPEFRGQWMIASAEGDTRTMKRPARPITIRDVLTHTSGMYANLPLSFNNLKTWMGMPLSQVVAMGAQQPLDFEPGTKWQYSNIGIATAARIVEVLADQPFEQFLASRIFQPLGMKDSYIFPPAEKHDRIASCYTLENGKLKEMGEDTLGGGPLKYRKGAKYSLPEGGMYSTAADLAAFYQMMLNGGTYNGKRLLSKSTIQVMTALHTGDLKAATPGVGYGLSWALVRDPMGSLSLPLASVGTYGHGGAFGTYGWVDPKKDLLGVFLVQRPGASDERNALMAIGGSAIMD
ncbi:MAG: class A beta-lactamase-related serine hydrolase [Bryobacterales bacterium]|nr:class A beta-lactamase-related serine hydrolase [Bryobacterales bacterium]